jgi:hypothetical protein
MREFQTIGIFLFDGDRQKNFRTPNVCRLTGSLGRPIKR